MGLSVLGVSGTSGVAVKCVDITRKARAEGAYWGTTDAEARKRGSKQD